MQLANFTLDRDGISLNWQGHNLDLHNCFDFESLQYKPLSQQVTLHWVRSAERWAKNTVLTGFKLAFKNVTFFRVRERDAAYPLTEDCCLMSMSFHPVAARDEFDTIYFSHSSDDDLTFFFQSEWGIKISAAAVALIPLASESG